MQDIILSDYLDFYINDIKYINLSRKAGHSVIHKNGKYNYSLIFTQSGLMKYYLTNESKKLLVSKNEMCFIPKDIEYRNLYVEDESKVKLLEFSLDCEIIPNFLQKPCIISNPDIKLIFEDINNITMTQLLYVTGKIYELLSFVKAHENKIPKKYKKIELAINQINSCYFENKKVQDYASICHMSESNFRKLFKEYTGKSFIEYRNIIRIREAQKLINSGECNVSEAAYLTGFNNMSFFYETLKKTIK